MQSGWCDCSIDSEGTGVGLKLVSHSGGVVVCEKEILEVEMFFDCRES